MGFLTEDRIDEHCTQVASALGQSPGISLTELKDIIQSLGCSDTEWQWLLDESRRKANEASNHFSANGIEEAIRWAERAVLINPFNIEGQMCLARASLKRYIVNSNPNDHRNAERAVRFVLSIDPGNTDAAKILNSLQVANKRQVPENQKKKNVMVIAIAVSLLVAGLGAAIIMNGAAESDVEADPTEKTGMTSHEIAELDASMENVQLALAQVVTVIRRRIELIPQLVALADSPDEELMVKVAELSERLNSASSNPVELNALNAEITNVVTQLLAFVKTDNKEVVGAIIVQLEGSVNRITVERKRYNEAVHRHNSLLKKVDSKQGFEPQPYME